VSRWKVEYGKAWQHLGGDTLGQTQIGYPQLLTSDNIPFNHPIDLHFAESGLQVVVALFSWLSYCSLLAIKLCRDSGPYDCAYRPIGWIHMDGEY
jgi:hypothetical protein